VPIWRWKIEAWVKPVLACDLRSGNATKAEPFSQSELTPDPIPKFQLQSLDRSFRGIIA
jgi:hypothetical protein